MEKKRAGKGSAKTGNYNGPHVVHASEYAETLSVTDKKPLGGQTKRKIRK